ncbi:MAG: 50S ribosomal protein L2, partial [Deltaproteobacteria bacterium]|nr:50S ribosomal protein L2 [Deltaproteobacteria bacterium]
MGVRNFRPTSAARRGMTVSDFAELTDPGKQPERRLTAPLKGSGARDNQGRISVRFHGGGHKRRYRIIDFRRDKIGVPAKVTAIEYDPNRSSRIALLTYADGDKRYILAPLGMNKGDSVLSADDADIRPGNCLPLFRIPMGTTVHAVEMKPGKGAQLAR